MNVDEPEIWILWNLNLKVKLVKLVPTQPWLVKEKFSVWDHVIKKIIWQAKVSKSVDVFPLDMFEFLRKERKRLMLVRKLVVGHYTITRAILDPNHFRWSVPTFPQTEVSPNFLVAIKNQLLCETQRCTDQKQSSPIVTCCCCLSRIGNMSIYVYIYINFKHWCQYI